MSKTPYKPIGPFPVAPPPQLPATAEVKVRSTELTAQNKAGIGIGDFVALAACLEHIGGHIEIAPGFMGVLKPGDYITRQILPNGSLELRLVHVEQQFVDPPELWPCNQPGYKNGNGLL